MELMWTSWRTPWRRHDSITLRVPTTVDPYCSGHPPAVAAPQWITRSAPATALSTASGSPRLPKR